MIDLALDPDIACPFATPFHPAAPDEAAILLGAYFRALRMLGVEAAGGDPQVAADFTPPRAMRAGWRPEAGLLEEGLATNAAPAQLRPLVAALLGDEPDAPLAVMFDGRPIRLSLAGSRRPYPLPGGWSPWAGDVGDLLARLETARALIAAHCPGVLPWIADAVAEIALLDGADGTRFSATAREYPGLVYLSLPLSPYDIAARLVHEASHQHYFALERLTSLHDGSDDALYHSPIKNRGRPIEAILFSFHAFGNGVLFDRLHGVDVAGAPNAATRARNEDGLRVMARHLTATAALTPVGTRLWQRLAEPLFA
jgi:HEXXH motif-containing protein